MTEGEITRLAAAGHALRPDWPAASLRTLLTQRHAHRGFQDTAVALAYLAADPLTRTPARLDAAGPWWRPVTGAGSDDRVPLPPRPGEWCPEHPGQWADGCAGCKADRVAVPAPAPSIRDPLPGRDRDTPGRRAARDAVAALARP